MLKFKLNLYASILYVKILFFKCSKIKLQNMNDCLSCSYNSFSNSSKNEIQFLSRYMSEIDVLRFVKLKRDCFHK